MTLFRFFTSIGILILLSSCASARKKELLSDSAENYVRALRGHDREIAISYVEPKKQIAYAKNIDKFKDFEVSQAEVKSIFPDTKLSKAWVTISLEYFSQAETQIRNEIRRIPWKYDDQLQAWLVDDTVPFGR